jgi:hypothetical protein
LPDDFDVSTDHVLAIDNVKHERVRADYELVSGTEMQETLSQEILSPVRQPLVHVNQVLALLSETDFSSLAPFLLETNLEQGHVPHSFGQKLERVYFS